jgi:putative transposase
MSLLGLPRRESWWKDAGIMMLRHQLAVAQRERPKAHARLTWPDRAWLALLAAVIERGTRRIRVLGATEHPVQSWVVQQARNLLMDLEDAGTPMKFVLWDRDASFTAAFDSVFQAVGARVIRSAAQAPRMNPIMERWAGSCRRELPDRTLVRNQRHLMTVLREYEDFCNTRRPHRSLKQAAPLRPLPHGITGPDQFRVQRRDRAGGVIHEYRLVA